MIKILRKQNRALSRQTHDNDKYDKRSHAITSNDPILKYRLVTPDKFDV